MELLTRIPAVETIGHTLQDTIIPAHVYEKHASALREQMSKSDATNHNTALLVRCHFVYDNKRVDVLMRKEVVERRGELIARAEFFEVVP